MSLVVSERRLHSIARPVWLPAVTEDPERDGRAQKGWNDMNEWFGVSSRQYYFSQ